MMLKKKIIEIGEEMTKFWHLEKMCRYQIFLKICVRNLRFFEIHVRYLRISVICDF